MFSSIASFIASSTKALVDTLIDIVTSGGAQGKSKKEDSDDSSGDSDKKLRIAKQRLQSKVSQEMAETYPYALKADDSYMELKYNRLTNVPAIDLYDGNYQSAIEDLGKRTSMEIESSQDEGELESVKANFKSDMTKIATQIQTYLREDTSDLEAAILWDAKNQKATKEHLTLHFKRELMPDDPIMTEVMFAYRCFMEYNAAQMLAFGSQNLINATYEAMLEGQSPWEYLRKILQLDSIARFGDDALNDNAGIKVPNAGVFGMLLF